MITPDSILGARILIVDDLPANVLLLERMLRGAGYTAIESTTNPLEVCELHRRNRYGLVVLDLHMPDMDGFEVMHGLRQIGGDGHLPILVITAQPEHKLRALRAGAMDFVGKPFEVAEVLARVHNMLEVHLLHLETKHLYDQLVAEKTRSLELAAMPGAMVGVEKEERLATRWPRSLALRHPWLQINLLTAFAAAAVVGLFQGTIDRLLILTMFLPVIAGQSGNTGSQALAITLRGITLGDAGAGKASALVRKEALLGLLNGALVGVVAGVGMYAVARLQNLPGATSLGAVVFLAMTGSCIVSGMSGAVVPLVLRRLGADPVTASSIFLTTATDVSSMGMLLGLAAVFVI